MKRRTFLKAVGAAVAALSFSPLLANPGFQLNDLRRITERMKAAAACGEDYCAIVHPGNIDQFVSIHRRGQWIDAYRAWRRDGRPGPNNPAAIWSRYARTLDHLSQVREIGRYESVRFIETRSLL